ncbi:hypothetical protein CCH79_00016447, partial [Gambusia affinis]
MESFKDLLQKLQEAHEREVKVKELSNKKGCDTKRMEELFTRNQQMKEQQRLLTENIKTLENRLRAGLCDRCTVTQEVAKRRQQEYEASHMQSLQHISLLAGEMTNLQKKNLKLKDEVASLRAELESGSEHNNNNNNNNNSVDVKPKMSPDLLSPGAVALFSPTIRRSTDQPADGDVVVKTEADHKREETECRLLRATTRSSFEVYKPQPTFASSSWKTEHRVNRGVEKSIEVLDQHSSIHTPHLRKKSHSSPSGEVRPSRPVIHAPIPCHPKPVKSGPVSLPWPLSEGPNWGAMAAVGANPALQNPSNRLHLSRLSNLIPPISQATTRRHGFDSSWQSHKQSAPQPPKEPTVVFTFRRMPENIENETKPIEKKESPPSKTQKVSGEELRESSDGPLDLSDRAKTKPSQSGNDDSPIALHCEGDAQRSPDRNDNTAIPVSSPSVISLPSSSSSTPIKQEQQLIGDHDHEVKDQDKKEEANDKTEESNGKKVPVLTLSLRP